MSAQELYSSLIETAYERMVEHTPVSREQFVGKAVFNFHMPNADMMENVVLVACDILKTILEKKRFDFSGRAARDEIYTLIRNFEFFNRYVKDDGDFYAPHLEMSDLFSSKDIDLTIVDPYSFKEFVAAVVEFVRDTKGVAL